MTADERFFAWLDGELGASEAAEMESRVAADPELALLAEQHRAMTSRLRGAFAQVAEAPVPERLASAVRSPAADVADLAAARRERDQRRSPVPRWAALAATLAIGVVIGSLVNQPSGAPFEAGRDGVYAAAGLDRALDAQLASAPSAGDSRIGLTFRDRGGAICRSFSGDAAAGLACRDGDRWRIRGLFEAPEGQTGDYRMAAGMDPNLAALIDSTIAGEPFDAAQERAAKGRGWR